MRQSTELSVVIVNWNNREMLARCIRAVQHNTLTPHEIIVIDNGSVDGSVAMLKRNFPSIQVIANKENLGFIRASNQGLRKAKGNFLLLLNDDAFVRPGAIDTLVRFMLGNPSAGACGPQLLNMDGTIQRQGGAMGNPFWKSITARSVPFVIGACLLTRRHVIEKVGLMDENLFFYNDDLDWCLRIRKAGWKIFIVPDAKVTHYGGYSSRRKFNRRLFVEGFRGGLYFCRKHYGEIAFHIYRITLGLLSPIAALAFLICYPFREKEKRGEIREKLSAYEDIRQIAMAAEIPSLPRA